MCATPKHLDDAIREAQEHSRHNLKTKASEKGLESIDIEAFERHLENIERDLREDAQMQGVGVESEPWERFHKKMTELEVYIVQKAQYQRGDSSEKSDGAPEEECF